MVIFAMHTLGAMFAHIDPTSVLMVGAMLLACGSSSLLVVRITNPRLGGLGWLGAAFFTGGLGAALLAFGQGGNPAASLLCDLLVLSAVVLLHVGVLETRQHITRFPNFGAVLMLIL